MKNLHLICNAHLDPVWLWDWEEGIAAALSTFRMAAKFCREYEGFIFNHNEALLYQWVEEYEPELFEEIRELVALGKWHIMGGWFLQPDCNMSSGESLLRQMEEGLSYFKEKFGVRPTTAINFDPFGHSRGLVQILTKAGFDSYIFCRPIDKICPLPSEDFQWIGFDGSSVMAHRSQEGYNTLLGEAEKKINQWTETYGDSENGMVLWGVGNHGGGPSYADLDKIVQMQKETGKWNLIHSTPEAYFAEWKERKEPVPQVEKGLNPFSIGCYTSQIRIKQRHRKLESELYLTEKMRTQAAIGAGLAYPTERLLEAQKVLLLSEFHDILPGTAVAPAEESSLKLMDHGLEILAQEKRKAFYALAKGQPAAGEGEYPILIYNPHPYPVEDIFTCEFQLQHQNWGTTFGMPVVYQDGKQIPSQVEKEDCNMNLDWRKKVAFSARLAPASMNRFDCKIEWLEKRPELPTMGAEEVFCFQNEEMEVCISRKTGLVTSIRTGEEQWIKDEAFALEVMESDADPWGMRLDSYKSKEGSFSLLNQEENQKFSGCGKETKSVRIVEDGAVRTVVEAVLGYGISRACIRYLLPKKGKKIGLEITVDWNEKGKLLKLHIPTTLTGGTPLAETIYGINSYEKDRTESVVQRWAGLFSEQDDRALLCINNGTYGMDFDGGDMRISMIHSAAYSAHPIEERPLLRQDRYIPFMDQGERSFSFQLQLESAEHCRETAGAEAVAFHEKPMAVSFFPGGQGESSQKGLLEIEDPAVQLISWRQSESMGLYRLRLFESTGRKRCTTLQFPELGLKEEISFGPYEIKTLELNVPDGSLKECEFIQ